MPTVSLCMCLKDESATLQAVIESALPAVDEVVIGVDESSTDDTLAIARRYASPGKLFTFQWQDDFAAARNMVLQRASGDIIAILDGHENLPSDADPTAAVLARMHHQDPAVHQIQTPLSFFIGVRERGIPDGYDVICVTLAMNPDAFGIPQLMFLQPRLFWRGEIHYQGDVHNHLAGHRRDHAIGCPEGVILHAMPPAREQKRKKQRKVMNISGLKQHIRDEMAKPVGDRVGRPWFYLGNTYSDMSQPIKAKPYYETYLKYSRFGEERRQALQQLAIIHFRHVCADLPETTDEEKATKREARARARVEARRYALEAMALGWQHSEPLLLLAELAFEEEDWDQVVHWCRLARQIPAPHSVMFIQGPAYSFMPAVRAMHAHVRAGRLMEAIEECQEALSWRQGDPDLIAQLDKLRMEQRDRENAKHDCNMLVVDRIGSFTGDLAGHFAKTRNVIRRETWDDRWRGWADMAWFEWCDANVIGASRMPWRGPIVCRLHSYEAFVDLPAQVNWPNIAALVCVADHIRDLVLEKWPHIQQQTRVRVIPNGVNANGLTYRERQHGGRIGVLGYLNGKKGVESLVELMREYRRYEWHIGGEFQDPHLAYWFRGAIEDLPHVWYHGWVQAKDEWLEGVDYLLSPSIVESFGYSIAEAMLKGIKPLVRARQGSRDLWPSECIWADVGEFEKVLQGPYESERYRDWVLQRYSLERQFALTDDLLTEIVGDAQPTNPLLLNAMPVSLVETAIWQPSTV